MRKHAVALVLVMLLAGAAYGMGNRKEIRYYPRDRVVEREVIRERPVYIEEKPSHNKWWQWRKSNDRDDRKREKEREKGKDREREKDRKHDH